tara:strand:- start:445 stop:714 length:270 start_codon:yes stop_codon:yes gene_type:complete
VIAGTFNPKSGELINKFKISNRYFHRAQSKTSNSMNSLRKIKIIGFPFAKSRAGVGAVNTPGWLLSQQWFQKLHAKPEAGLSCELVNVK